MDIRMSNIASPMPQIRAKFTNKLGIPLSGCKVYTYEPNSNIPKTTWVDIDKTVENTNPILLDAAGEADIFLDGLYRIVVKDRFGFVVYDVEKTGTTVELDASFVVDGDKNQKEINALILDPDSRVPTDKMIKTWSGRTQEDKNKDILSFEDFLSANDASTVQDAISSKKTLTLKNKVYDMGDARFLTLTPENSDTVINGNGATLKFSDPTYVGGTRLHLLGTNTELPNLNVDVNVGDNQIEFVSAHSLSIGDLISIRSDRSVEYSEGATTRYIGELLTVAKVLSNTVIVTHESTVYAYKNSFNAKLFKINPVSNVTIKDLNIEDAGLDPKGTAIENQKPIVMQMTKDCLIDNVHIKNACGQQISIKDSYGWTIRNCTLAQEQIDAIDTWSQYGVSVVDYSRNGLVQNVHVKGFKTGISFTDSGTGYGVSIDTVIDGCKALDCTRIISMHATTRDLKVYNVVGDSCVVGMNIRCADVIIRDFHMKRSRTFQGRGATLFTLSNVVRNLDIADVSMDGGFYGISTIELGMGYPFENISIKRANFKNIRNTVLNLDFSTGNLDVAKGFELSGVTFTNCTGVRLILKGNFSKPIIENNKFGDAAIGAYGCDLTGVSNAILKRNDFGLNLIPFRFTDLNPTIKSLNNLIEDNTWERDTGIATGTSQQYIVGRSNTRTNLGGNHITDLSSFTYRIAEGTRYLTSSVPTGSLRTLRGGNIGDLIVIRAVSGVLTIQGTENITLKSTEIVLDAPSKIAVFVCVGVNWMEI